MIEALALVGGGLMRLAPSILDFFKEGRDLKYEVQRMDKEIQLEEKRGENRQLELVQVGAQAVDTRWADGLVEALKSEGDRSPSGIKLLDWLSSSVRPVLTYWWCIGLYSSHKAVIIYAALLEKLPAAQMAPILLTDFDRAVVASIIGFWFVDRALRGRGLK